MLRSLNLIRHRFHARGLIGTRNVTVGVTVTARQRLRTVADRPGQVAIASLARDDLLRRIGERIHGLRVAHFHRVNKGAGAVPLTGQAALRQRVTWHSRVIRVRQRMLLVGLRQDSARFAGLQALVLANFHDLFEQPLPHNFLLTIVLIVTRAHGGVGALQELARYGHARTVRHDRVHVLRHARLVRQHSDHVAIARVKHRLA